MPDYRRHRVPGGIYFFTVNLRDRRSHLLVTEIDSLRSAVRAARARRPFHIDAWVVLPDHMHCLWTLPPGDMDFPVRWRTIKATFSRCVPPAAERRASLVRKREAGHLAAPVLGARDPRRTGFACIWVTSISIR